MDKVGLFSIGLSIGLAVVSANVPATTIYKCKTPRGVEFSEKPCAPDAVKIQTKSSRSTGTSSSTGAAGATPRAGTIDIDEIGSLGAKSTEAIIALVGSPAASYVHDGDERWLYPNVVDTEDGRRYCPEVLIRDGVSYQTNWIPEAVMKQSVIAANRFAGWSPPAQVHEKRYYATDSAVEGENKSAVVRKMGEPDGKRVFNGRELWEYEKVRMSANSPQMLTIYLEFEGDTVASSVGN